MIEGGDVYKVVVAMVPLYVALGLGYASAKWWRMFTPDQCEAVNRFNCYFIIPFFTFNFIIGVNPYRMNYKFLAGDIVAKAIAGAALALWANLWKKGNLSWAITSFSLSSFNNTLYVGVPLLRAMYGSLGEDLVVQSSVIQTLLWFPILLFLLEFRRTFWINRKNSVVDDVERNEDGEHQQTDSVEIVATRENGQHQLTDSVEIVVSNDSEKHAAETVVNPPSSFGSMMNKVCLKVLKNPNCYACALGFIWALIAKRWNLAMPSIVEGSILIMAKAGTGVAMFSMGLFMALQEKVIACGLRLAFFGMILRFVCGPLATAVGCAVFGLRSNVLRIAIIQAALPQAISAFVFAQEYGLHADVLSTAVIFGTVVSLPLLIGYYAVLDIIR